MHPPGRLHIIASARRPEQAQAIREAGALALDMDFDRPRPFRQLAGLAPWIIIAVPPSERHHCQDLRSRELIAKLRANAGRHQGAAVAKLVYISTTGVFGDWEGGWIDETAKPRAKQARSLRRLDAEQCFTKAFHAVRLRAPGIYAEDRLPLRRIQQGLPAIVSDDDSYSNHIHADDLASIAWLSLFRAPPARLYAVVDNEPLKMGDWFDHIARCAGLEKLPRAPREAVQAAVNPMMWSFLQESRQIRNHRMLREIRPKLKAASARDFIDRVFSTPNSPTSSLHTKTSA